MLLFSVCCRQKKKAYSDLINQPPEATSEFPSPVENVIEYQNEQETSGIQQDIAERWLVQRMLEEMVTAVRQENSDDVLTGLANPGIQTYFTRDRAALLSLLAIMSSSNQPVLLDYVRQTLVSSPGLVHEQYTYGQTLLHEVAGWGHISIVELLLHLGADPNARNQWEHTPLYVVGNASRRTDGAAVVRILVHNGADVNAQEKLKHCTPLHNSKTR